MLFTRAYYSSNSSFTEDGLRALICCLVVGATNQNLGQLFTEKHVDETHRANLLSLQTGGQAVSAFGRVALGQGRKDEGEHRQRCRVRKRRLHQR